MVTISKLSCGNFGEDDLVAVTLDDGSIVLQILSKDQSIRRHTVEPDDTLRVSSEMWNDPLPCMESELTIVSKCGSSTRVTHFELNAMWGGVHPDDVGAFANAVADACGCGVNVLPTREREFTKGGSPMPVRDPEPKPRPSYMLYVDRPGVEVIASVGYLNALQLPDGTVVVERQPSGVFRTITASDTLVVSAWQHTIPKPVTETWLMCLGHSGALAEFEWNPTDKSGIQYDDVVAFAEAVAEATRCKVTRNDPK